MHAVWRLHNLIHGMTNSEYHTLDMKTLLRLRNLLYLCNAVVMILRSATNKPLRALLAQASLVPVIEEAGVTYLSEKSFL